MADRSPSPIDGLFDRDGQERKVNRILDKAVNKSVKQATRGSGTVGQIQVPKFKKGQGKRSQKAGFASALAKALSARVGAVSKNKPSLRKSAPDTGGRSFHFEYYSVSKGQAAAPVNGGGKAGSQPGTAKAHQRYIERELAVEAVYAPNEILDMPRKRGRPSKAEIVERAAAAALAEKALGKDKQKTAEIDGRERSLGRAELENSQDRPALAGQAYIENPAKLKNGELGLSSFGNIGATFEERIRFWELVEEHEPRGDARLQNRLILELPHQSTPKSRVEIMKRFVQPLADKNLPYHVAIHAPGEKNDSRNYHAHVIFSERPASKMQHPETGQEVWDFTVEEAYKTKSRNTKISHPFRQRRLRDVKDKTFVYEMRKDFARIVTEVMASVDSSVKFDARSYKDMGLDIMPMRTLNRVLHDRMRDGKLVLDSPGWTKRMVSAELEAAAQRQDPDVTKLLASTKALENLRDAWPSLGAINKHLAATSRIAGLTGFTKRLFRSTIERRIRLEAEIASERLMAKAEIEVCNKLIKASRPLTVKTVGGKEPRHPEEQAKLDVIHETAREELAATKQRLKTAESAAKIRIKQNTDLFQKAGKGFVVQPGQATAAAPEDASRRRTTHASAKPTPAITDAPVKASGAKAAKVGTAQARIMWEPEYVEIEEKRRKRREAQQQRELAAVTAKLQQEEAKKRKPGMKVPHAPQVAREDEDPAERRRRIAKRQADEIKIISDMVGKMYDPELRGQAFADSLKPMLDQLYPERNGVHGPDPREEALRAATATATAREQAMQPGTTPDRSMQPDSGSDRQRPAPMPTPAPNPRQAATADRGTANAGPERTEAPAPRPQATKPDLSNLPKPPPRGPLRIRDRPANEGRSAPQSSRTPVGPGRRPPESAVLAPSVTPAAATVDRTAQAAPDAPRTADRSRNVEPNWSAPICRINEDSSAPGAINPMRGGDAPRDAFVVSPPKATATERPRPKASATSIEMQPPPHVQGHAPVSFEQGSNAEAAGEAATTLSTEAIAAAYAKKNKRRAILRRGGRGGRE